MVLVQLLSAFSILGLGVNIWRLEGGKDNNLCGRMALPRADG